MATAPVTPWMVIALMNSISLALPDFDDFLDIPVFVFDFVPGMLLTAGIEPYVCDISVDGGDVINVEFLHDVMC
jgi:hypothetical protein